MPSDPARADVPVVGDVGEVEAVDLAPAGRVEDRADGCGAHGAQRTSAVATIGAGGEGPILTTRVEPCKQVLHHTGRTLQAGPSPHGSDPASRSFTTRVGPGQANPSSNLNSTPTAARSHERQSRRRRAIDRSARADRRGQKRTDDDEHPAKQPAAGPGQCWAAASPPSVWLARSRSPPPRQRTTPVGAVAVAAANPRICERLERLVTRTHERRDTRLEAGTTPGARSRGWRRGPRRPLPPATRRLAQLYSDRAVRRTETVALLQALGPDLAGAVGRHCG